MPLEWNGSFVRSEHKINNEMVQAWLKEPQIFWLEQMQVRIKESSNHLEDIESLQLDELQRFSLLNLQFLNNKKFLLNPDELPEKTDWQQQLKGQGILPLKAAGDIECGILDARWKSLGSQLRCIGKLEVTKLAIKG